METKVQFDLSAIALDDAYTAFWQSRRAQNVSKATLQFYSNTVAPFIAWCKNQGICDPNEINTQTVENYIASVRERGVSDLTLHAHARAVRTMLIYLFENEFISKHVKVKMPRTGDVDHQVLSGEEIVAVFNACVTPRDQAIVSFMLDTGVRRQEVANLTWHDVDLKAGAVHIVRGKGRKSRWVGISPLTIKYIITYRRVCKTKMEPEDNVFQTDDGKAMQGETLRQIFVRISRRTGFHVHPHVLRHTYATNAHESGMDLRDIQVTMGHAESTTTERYIKTLPSRIIARQIEHSLVMKMNLRKKRG